MRSPILARISLAMATMGWLCDACGGETTGGGTMGTGGSAGSGTAAGGATSSGGTAGSGGSGGAAGSGGSGQGSCPLTPPAPGSPCTSPWDSAAPFPVAAHCTWGDDPRPECRTTGRCVEAKWVISPAETTCSVPPLPPSCLTPPPANGTKCADTSLACWYGDGTRCRCSGCQGGAEYPICRPIDPSEWWCDTPAVGCPTNVPQAGEPCSMPGASCGRDCALTVRCEGGVWRWIQGSCPICAAPDTPLATPLGERPIASLMVGDLVYSVDHDAIVAVPIAHIGRTPVAAHTVVRVVLDNGTVLQMSPGHPTGDGRTFAELAAGSSFDALRTVKSAELVPYAFDATYDVLPASSTGTYFAAGALVGSTLGSIRVDARADR